MTRKKKSKESLNPIVAGFIERVNAKIFDKYQKQIKDMIKGHQGIYSLYRKNNLYYVGLATNLRNRIRHHLRDRHQGKWTHFSLYIIRKADYIKQLESLVLRIAYPEGNTIRGKLEKSKNLLPVLQKQVKSKIQQEYEELFKQYKRTGEAPVKKQKVESVYDLPLKGLLRHYQPIFAQYKGKQYKANVLRSGKIKLSGKIYLSLSGAAKSIIDSGAVNGWNFWKYEDKDGTLKPLKLLKK